MNAIQRPIALCLLVVGLSVAACAGEDNAPTGPPVEISGTVDNTAQGHQGGNYVILLFQSGVSIDSPDWLVKLELGTGLDSFAYALPVNGNLGDVYVFGYNDADADDVPNDATDPNACSNVFNLGADDVAGVDLVMDMGAAWPNCSWTP